MSSESSSWIVCQIGARERYVVARELHKRGQLAALCTDIWVSPGSMAFHLARLAGTRGVSFTERYEPALKDARVLSENAIVAAFSRVRAQHRGETGAGPVVEADRWHGARMAGRLEKSGLLRAGADKKPPVVFSYSYAAREIFELARRFGCRTVLGQIDCGPFEEEIVAGVAQRHGLDDDEGHQRASQKYWENWRQECKLADAIVVNSQWTAMCLGRAGIDDTKIHIAPLAYDDRGATNKFHEPRSYPAAFSHDRPLRLLFLGQVGVRKGAFETLEAMKRLQELPITLTLVGPIQSGLRERFGMLSQVDWAGKVSYREIDAYYKASDLFLLPTHSDGFALTQLEAQARGLPILASSHCGEVVVDGVNGRLIEPITPAAIEELIRWSLANPSALQTMSQQAFQRAKQFTAARSIDALLEAITEN